MLLKLPEEILIEVFCYLNFYAKLNLATTCRKVKDSLYGTTFYEEVVVPWNRTDEVLLFFKNEPDYGSKVKSCTIYRIPDDKTLFIQLPAIFPNLTKFEAVGVFFEDDQDMSTNFIRTLSDRLQQCFPSIQIYLSEFTFNNLMELTINGSERFVQNNPNYYQSLRNAPSLSSLKITRFFMRTELLEEIHTNCPTLKHLELSVAQFEMNDTPFGLHMQPADNLESFILDVAYTRSFTYQAVLNYVVEKYPYLKKMKLFLYENRRSVTEFQGSNTVSPVLLNRLVNRIQSLHLDELLFDHIMNNDDIDLANIRDLGFRSYYVSLSPLLKYVTGCSKIHSITSLTSLSLPIGHFMKLLDDGLTLSNLKTLILIDGSSPKRDVHLDVLINSCPNLETLDFQKMDASISINSTEQNRSFALRNLRIDMHKVDPKLFDFIRSYLPNLQKLKFHIHDGQRWDGFELPEHTLHEFDVYIITNTHQFGPLGECHFYYNVKTQRETKKLELQDFQEYLNVKEMTAEEWEQESKAIEVTFSCKELLTMKYQGVIVF